MKLDFILPAGLLLLACAAQAGPRDELLGRWRSDRATTMAKLEGHPKVTPQQRALLAEILGELVIEYTARSVTLNLDDWQETRPYEVVAEGPGFVDLRSYDTVLEQTTVRRVWVKGARMWIWVEGSKFFEYFERIP